MRTLKFHRKAIAVMSLGFLCCLLLVGPLHRVYVQSTTVATPGKDLKRASHPDAGKIVMKQMGQSIHTALEHAKLAGPSNSNIFPQPPKDIVKDKNTDIKAVKHVVLGDGNGLEPAKLAGPRGGDALLSAKRNFTRHVNQTRPNKGNDPKPLSSKTKDGQPSEKVGPMRGKDAKPAKKDIPSKNKDAKQGVEKKDKNAQPAQKDVPSKNKNARPAKQDVPSKDDAWPAKQGVPSKSKGAWKAKQTG